jgi:hypothetical protein
MGAVEVALASARVGPGTATRSGGGATPGSAAEDGTGIFYYNNSEDHKVPGDKHAFFK